MIESTCQNIWHKTQSAAIPAWAESISIARFQRITQRTSFDTLALADFFKAVQTDDDGKREVRAHPDKTQLKVDHLPAWALTQIPEQGAGTLEGKPNGLFQLDFDHAEQPERLKADLVTIPGILFAALSARGKGVFALMYAPDHNAGVWVADAIADELKGRGHRFERDKRCDAPNYVRFESYDAAPFIAPTLLSYETLIRDYSKALERSHARKAFEVWTNQNAPDYESAATAIFAASLCANVASAYGGNTYPAKCDVQILAKSGSCKTEGRTKPLRKLARFYGVDQAGGLRTTDAAFYDQFIKAAFAIECDDKGKIKGLTPKKSPDKLACILDESGDTERSRAGNSNKAQQNLIRRIACYDGEINIGATAEQQRQYNWKLPATIDACLVMYRICTPNQLAGKNFDDEAEGGNARRVLYAKMTNDTERPILDAVKAQEEKARRILSPYSDSVLQEISENLRRECAGDKPKVFMANFEGETRTAYQCARIAFMRAGIDVESCLDTCIFNTCAWLCALRNACNPDKAHDQITANEIDTACALFLNSFALVNELRSEGAEKLLVTARTNTERQNLILKMFEGGKALWKGNAKRYIKQHFGSEVIAVADDMLKNGILREVVETSEKGNRNTLWELTPDGEQEKAAAEYAKAHESRRTKQKSQSVFDGNTGKPLAERLNAYLKSLYDVGKIDHTHNDDTLRSIAGKIRGNPDFMKDESACFEWFRDLVLSPDFDTSRSNPYTDKDVERLWRPLP